MTGDRPGELHVIGRRGLPLPVGWLAGFVVPCGVSIEFVDLGRRCDVHVVRGRQSATVLADLATGLALVAEDHVDDDQLTALARGLLARRIAANPGGQPSADGESPLRDLAATVGGARWVTIS